MCQLRQLLPHLKLPTAGADTAPMVTGRKRLVRAVLVLLGLCVVAVWVLATPKVSARYLPVAIAEAIPGSSLDRCDASWYPDAGRTACTADHMQARLAADGLEALDELETWARTHPRAGGGCHVIMHDIGRRRTVERLESGDTAEFPESDDTACAAGFRHGAIMAMVDNGGKDALASVTALCRSQQTPLGAKGCYHGLGHSFMRTTEGDPAEAGVMCRALGAPDVDCWPGLFHDYALGLDRLDGAAASKPIEEPAELCERADARLPGELEACWVWALPIVQVRAADAGIVDAAEEIEQLCQTATGPHAGPCRTAAGEYMSRQEGAVADWISACGELDAKWRGGCFRGVATGMAERVADNSRTPTAYLDACAALRGDDVTTCAREIGRVASFVAAEPIRGDCKAQDEPARGACLAGARSFHEPLGII